MDRISNSSPRRFSNTSSDSQHQDVPPPPPPDEAYWSALLREGETAAAGPQRQTGASWDSYDSSIWATTDGSSEAHEGDWRIAQETSEQDRTVELSVIGYNRGGLLV